MCDSWAGARGCPAPGQENGFQRVECPLRYFRQGTNGLQIGYGQATNELQVGYE